MDSFYGQLLWTAIVDSYLWTAIMQLFRILTKKETWDKYK